VGKEGHLKKALSLMVTKWELLNTARVVQFVEHMTPKLEGWI